jgi:hypothetical protein
MFFPSETYDAVNQRIRREQAADACWLPSKVYQSQSLYVHEEYFEARLREFRTLLLPYGTAHWPDCPRPSAPWFSTHPWRHGLMAWRELTHQRRLWSSMLAQLDQPWPNFREDLIGQPYHVRRYLFVGTPDTETNLRTSFYYGLLRAHAPMLDEARNIIEIG